MIQRHIFVVSEDSKETNEFIANVTEALKKSTKKSAVQLRFHAIPNTEDSINQSLPEEVHPDDACASTGVIFLISSTDRFLLAGLRAAKLKNACNTFMKRLVETLNERRVDNLSIVLVNTVGEKTLRKFQKNDELLRKLYKRARVIDVKEKPQNDQSTLDCISPFTELLSPQYRELLDYRQAAAEAKRRIGIEKSKEAACIIGGAAATAIGAIPLGIAAPHFLIFAIPPVAAAGVVMAASWLRVARQDVKEAEKRLKAANTEHDKVVEHKNKAS